MIGGDRMAVVKETQIEGAVIRIHDDCCSHVSDDEIEAILKRIASNAMAELNSGQNKQKKTG